ncbi:hypothetical protein [Flavobacterium sp. JP2137]|uniref:hypothetical protein n=1 Tax=Flavobacterium sp. JP2137 TaxID=3414510 RepID=UPI003D2FCA21
MGIIGVIKSFWLDFFAAYYQQLMRNAKYETPLSIVIHTTFVQAVNCTTLLVLIMHFLFSTIRLNYIFFISPMIVLIVINSYYFYYKLNDVERDLLLNRKPKYKVFIYTLYSLLSTVFLVFALIMASKV